MISSPSNQNGRWSRLAKAGGGDSIGYVGFLIYIHTFDFEPLRDGGAEFSDGRQQFKMSHGYYRSKIGPRLGAVFDYRALADERSAMRVPCKK